MGTKTIPASTIKTCDRCGVVMDGKNDRQDGAVLLKAHALDMHGFPCADASSKFDLCDGCLPVVTDALRAAIAGINTKG